MGQAGRQGMHQSHQNGNGRLVLAATVSPHSKHTCRIKVYSKRGIYSLLQKSTPRNWLLGQHRYRTGITINHTFLKNEAFLRLESPNTALAHTANHRNHVNLLKRDYQCPDNLGNQKRHIKGHQEQAPYPKTRLNTSQNSQKTPNTVRS
jgi:hypothetical protein